MPKFSPRLPPPPPPPLPLPIERTSIARISSRSGLRGPVRRHSRGGEDRGGSRGAPSSQI